MMLGVNSFSIMFTVLGLLTSGEIPVLVEFFKANPACLNYNIVTAVCR